MDQALDAMSAPELRAALRAVLDHLDGGVKNSAIARLMTRGARANSGWKPTRPSPRIVDEARSFAEAARRVGRADPYDVTEHLRRAMKAFLAGNHASARAVFEAILPSIGCVDIDLGQHELVEEVLGVDARACVAQYAVSVYTTTAIRERADAIIRALNQVEGVGTLSSPIKDMEDVSAGALPDLTAFLPLWVKRLQRFRPSKDEWETEHERWLREAVFRADGIDGLERIARKTKRPRACLAWYEALADQGDWPAALGACDVAARMVRQEHKPPLTTPSMLALIQRARPSIALTDPDRDAAIDAMRTAAERRVEGILGNSRRPHYGHAALLVASCVAYAPKKRTAEFVRWAKDLRQQYWRRHAFREELARACESLGVLVPA